LEDWVAKRKRQTSEQKSSHQPDFTSRHSEASHMKLAVSKEIPPPTLENGLPSSPEPDLFRPHPEDSEFIYRPHKRPNTSEDLSSQRKKHDSKMLLEPSAPSAVNGSPRSSSYGLNDNLSYSGSTRCISASSSSGSVFSSFPSSSSTPDDNEAETRLYHNSTSQAKSAEERERQKILEQKRRRSLAQLSNIDMYRQRDAEEFFEKQYTN